MHFGRKSLHCYASPEHAMASHSERLEFLAGDFENANYKITLHVPPQVGDETQNVRKVPRKHFLS